MKKYKKKYDNLGKVIWKDPKRVIPKPISHIFPSTSFSLNANSKTYSSENEKKLKESDQYFKPQKSYYPWNSFYRKRHSKYVNPKDAKLQQDILRYSLQESDMHRRWGNGFLKRYPVTQPMGRFDENVHIPIPCDEMQSFSLYPSL